MAKFHIHPWAKLGTLKNSTVMDLTTEMSNMKIENDLRREVQESIMRLKDMGTYRGRRHAMGLPVRGQRTRTQVCGGVVMWRCEWTLTVADYDGEKTEQAGARWTGTGAVVVRGRIYHVLYYTAKMKMHQTALVITSDLHMAVWNSQLTTRTHIFIAMLWLYLRDRAINGTTGDCS
jgi:hypothetical protein